MHPLSSQPLGTSCWVTSMINGIMYLHKGKRVPFMAYRLLHNLLVEDGVFYYTKKEQQQFEAVIQAVGACSNLEITYRTADDVENLIRDLNYTNQVAVCDIGSGDHSILINGFQNGAFEAFDHTGKTSEAASQLMKSTKNMPPIWMGRKTRLICGYGQNTCLHQEKAKVFKWAQYLCASQQC